MNDIRHLINKIDQLNEFQTGGGERHGPHAYGFAIKEYAELYFDEMSDESTDLGSVRDDAIDIANVGGQFLIKGMAAGIAALFELDTFVSDSVLTHLEGEGFNVRQEIINARVRHQGGKKYNKLLSILKASTDNTPDLDSDPEDIAYQQSRLRLMHKLLPYFKISDEVGMNALQHLIDQNPSSGELDDINDLLY